MEDLVLWPLKCEFYTTLRNTLIDPLSKNKSRLADKEKVIWNYKCRKNPDYFQQAILHTMYLSSYIKPNHRGIHVSKGQIMPSDLHLLLTLILMGAEFIP